MEMIKYELNETLTTCHSMWVTAEVMLYKNKFIVQMLH